MKVKHIFLCNMIYKSENVFLNYTPGFNNFHRPGKINMFENSQLYISAI